MKKNPRKNKSDLAKLWYFIWYDDSLLSWIVNVVLAFLIIKFLFYPALSFVAGSPLPLVAVTSSSMEHRVSDGRMCGESVDLEGKVSFDEWWGVCGSWYEDNENISKSEFESFVLKNGFNKGDIILLKGTKNLGVGDVVVFGAAKKYPVIHRIVELDDSNIKTKGDNNPDMIVDSQLDESNVEFDSVLGRAYFRVPYVGFVKIWFTELLNLV